MTLRVEVQFQARDGRVLEAVELMHRINDCIVDMGGPAGHVFQATTGTAVGGGYSTTWDFDDLNAWATWEEPALENEKFAALFGEVVDPSGPIVAPFRREFWRSVP
jgi:hypothetical protein